MTCGRCEDKHRQHPSLHLPEAKNNSSQSVATSALSGGLPIHYVLQESVPSLIYGRDIAMFPERWLFSDWSISLIFIALLNGIF